jgi:ABC-type cobalamin/Fe3+-siderophores transport system ATPase subunit
MQVRKFRIVNYKSFRDSGEITLREGLNLFTGKNSAGKTALLQALELRFSYKPHLSLETMPHRGQYFQAASYVDMTIKVTGEELREFTEHLPEVRFTLPVRPAMVGMPFQPNGLNTPENLRGVWDWLHSRPAIEFRFRCQALPDGTASVYSIQSPSHGLYTREELNTTNARSLIRRRDQNGVVSYQLQFVDSDFINEITPALLSRIYRFSAERFGLGDSKFGPTAVLAPDASNLAEVLSTLQPNVDKFADYVALVRKVLPQIEWISVKPRDSDKLRIVIWNHPKESQRDDLAIPLTECGTGIGQVLAILYVAFSSSESRILLIDEPQSFLHPGAARKLVEVLESFPQHQYLISTHSPTVVSAADPKEIIIAAQAGAETKLETESVIGTQSVNRFLREVGAQLSDVFGMDHVIWVEGPTEVLVFGSLLRNALLELPATTIVPIRNTGDLEGKDAKKYLEMYRNLSSNISLMPRTVRFLLDTEARKPEDLQELRNLSGGCVEFLPKRMIENYLLHVPSIVKVINSIPGFVDGEPLTAEQLETFISGEILKVKYWKPFAVPVNPSADNENLHAAEVLAAIFGELSDQRVSFSKTQHGPLIAEAILNSAPEKLAGLKLWLESAFRVS